MVRAAIRSKITLFTLKHKINFIHWFGLVAKRTKFNFRFGVLFSSVGVCGPLLAEEPGWTVISVC